MRSIGRWTAVVVLVAVHGCGGEAGPVGPIDDGVDPVRGAAACTLPGSSGWTFSRLGAGAKPAFAIAGDGTVHAAFINEAVDGWVRYASLPSGSQDASPVETVAEGYFYGPIELVLQGSQPSVLYHDHSATDQVLGSRAGNGAWTLNAMVNTGHDGWYNSAAFAPNGSLHTATYDPSGFNGRGVIYGVWSGSSWAVDLAAAGSYDYAGGMALGLTNTSDVHIAFFDDVAGEPRITSSEDGSWHVTTPEPKGAAAEVGRFPDLAIDSDGSTVHLVYLSRTGASGTVRYAKGVPGAFEIIDAMDISDFQIGHDGARDLATLALAADGSAVIAAQTNRSMRVVRVTNGAAAEIASFAAPDGIFFGQQTEVEIDAQGRIHVVWWQSGESPGTVCHAVSG